MTRTETPKKRMGRPVQTPGWRGDVLEAARLSRGLSIREAARRLGVDPSTFLRWERGDFTPPPERVGELARLVRVRKALLTAPK